MAAPITQDVVIPDREAERLEVARTWRLLVLAVLGGVVLVVLAVLLVGITQVSRARQTYDAMRGQYLQVAKKESKVVGELEELGADVTGVRGAYDAMLAGTSIDPDAAAALHRDLAALHASHEPIQGSNLKGVYKGAGQRVVRLQRAHADWQTAATLWRDAVASPQGSLIVTLGLEQGPPSMR